MQTKTDRHRQGGRENEWERREEGGRVGKREGADREKDRAVV